MVHPPTFVGASLAGLSRLQMLWLIWKSCNKKMLCLCLLVLNTQPAGFSREYSIVVRVNPMIDTQIVSNWQVLVVVSPLQSPFSIAFDTGLPIYPCSIPCRVAWLIIWSNNTYPTAMSCLLDFLWIPYCNMLGSLFQCWLMAKNKQIIVTPQKDKTSTIPKKYWSFAFRRLSGCYNYCCLLLPPVKIDK